MVHPVLTEVPVLMGPPDHPAPLVLPWGPTTLDPTTRGPPGHSEYIVLVTPVAAFVWFPH